MEDTYFIISNSDGDTSVTPMTESELLDALGEDYWGDVDFLKNLAENDTNYWGGDILIIKGSMVIPKPKAVVTSYEL